MWARPPASRSAHVRERVAGVEVVADHGADPARRCGVAGGERQVERQLVEAVRTVEVGQAHPAEAVAERGAQHVSEHGGQAFSLGVGHRVPGGPHQLGGELGLGVVAVEGDDLEQVVHQVAEVDAGAQPVEG